MENDNLDLNDRLVLLITEKLLDKGLESQLPGKYFLQFYKANPLLLVDAILLRKKMSASDIANIIGEDEIVKKSKKKRKTSSKK
jgi:hypothetical protein